MFCNDTFSEANPTQLHNDIIQLKNFSVENEVWGSDTFI
jgi:hypothetical protein